MTILQIIQVLTISLKINNPNLLNAICWVESNHRNIDNMSDGGSPSYGVCQIKLATANWMKEHFNIPGVELEPSDLQKPEINIYYSGLYLTYLSNRYKNDLKCIISGYNAGSCIEANQNTYVKKVLDKIKALESSQIDSKEPTHNKPSGEKDELKNDSRNDSL